MYSLADRTSLIGLCFAHTLEVDDDSKEGLEVGQEGRWVNQRRTLRGVKKACGFCVRRTVWVGVCLAELICGRLRSRGWRRIDGESVSSVSGAFSSSRVSSSLHQQLHHLPMAFSQCQI